MDTVSEDEQTICIDIKNFRPSYEIEEHDEQDGFDESFTLMVRGSAELVFAEASDLAVIQVTGTRIAGADWIGSDEGAVLGLGWVKAMKDGLFAEAKVPFDVVLKLSGSLEAGAIGKVVIDYDPITAIGASSYIRRLRFVPA